LVDGACAAGRWSGRAGRPTGAALAGTGPDAGCCGRAAEGEGWDEVMVAARGRGVGALTAATDATGFDAGRAGRLGLFCAAERGGGWAAGAAAEAAAEAAEATPAVPVAIGGDGASTVGRLGRTTGVGGGGGCCS
jgi:hypothetical protein